jgi:hypothetical protein
MPDILALEGESALDKLVVPAQVRLNRAVKYAQTVIDS